MTFDPNRWLRFPVRDTAVWLCPERPSWFVPTRRGDELLVQWQAGRSSRELESFFQRLPAQQSNRYQGRQTLIPEQPSLNELWLHITDRCNLSCSHCLFCSGPDQAAELSLETLSEHIDQAAASGCRLFALTGGEPLLHRDFQALIDKLLSIDNSRIVILSNGLLAEKMLRADWPRERIHLQISLDGQPQRHDAIRGANAFARLDQQLRWLNQSGWEFTLSCCITKANAGDLNWLVNHAADCGAASLHLMWHFIRGRGTSEQHIEPLALLEPLLEAKKIADQRNLRIDNLESLKGQIFAPPGTIHDGCSPAWETAAIGPDNRLYPSAASIGFAELATELEQGLQQAWQQSPVLGKIRQTSVVSSSDPWRFLLGGGDFDHCWHHAQRFSGCDPYQPLFEQLALTLIAEAAQRLPQTETAALRLKMGELLISCGQHGPVALCHSNCLLALPEEQNGREQVGHYYAEAVGDKRLEILNPVQYDEQMMAHIPAEYRFRGYGCGSPVLDAGLQNGDKMVDLGCGSGVECFIAARLVGDQGQVTGIDMLEPMLAVARQGAAQIREKLGYDNLQFKQGYLEQLPLGTDEQDLVVSNCVLNLSTDKRLTFAEIFRILRPGGRLVAADVVCESEPDAAILNDEILRGECISGALTQKDLLGILEETGFGSFSVIKRLPYRVVQGHPFYSLTFSVVKPQPSKETVKVLYPGPAAQLTTPSGAVLRPGQSATIPQSDAELLGEQLWQLDSQGYVTNVAMEAGANCALPPEAQSRTPKAPADNQQLHQSGCLVCGAELRYREVEEQQSCHYCGQSCASNACCEQGHFVCDSCHSGDTLELIENLCQQARDTDALELFQSIRRHPSMPVHGPQYHALVPGVLLACLGNAGLPVSAKQLKAAISRGGDVNGGSCGFWGICGAAVGVGIAFSVLLEATPVKAEQRQTVQQIVAQILTEIASHNAARCCQRDCFIALRSGMQLAAERWQLNIPPIEPFKCSQIARNKECLGQHCPLWPAQLRSLAASA